MTLEVRRIVTGHDSAGKAVVASDERMTGASAPSRPYISRVEIWSADRMPVDNSEAAAAAQKHGFVVRHNYNGPGPCVFAFVLIDADPVEAAGKKLTTDFPAA